MNTRIAIVLIAATLLGLSARAVADTLVLTNGTRVSGKIIDAEAEPIVLKIPKGKISYNHSEVAEIILDGAEFQAGTISGDTKKFTAALAGMPAGPVEALDAQDAARVLWYLDELDKVAVLEADKCEDTGFNEERRELVSGLAGIGPGASPIIEQALQEGNPGNAPYYLAGLVEANPTRGAKVATQAVQTHGSASVREMAVKLLAEKNPAAHVATFTRAAQDQQGHVRFAALNGLRDAADPAAAPTLAAALDDVAPRNRKTALLGLSEMAGKSFKTPEEARTWYRNRGSGGK